MNILTPLTWCFLFFALFGLLYTALALAEALKQWCIKQVIHWRWRRFRRARRYPHKVIRS